MHHGQDFTDEMLLNVFPEDYASYTKGCFVGQEVLARVHNLSKPPRKLTVQTTNGIRSFVFTTNKTN